MFKKDTSALAPIYIGISVFIVVILVIGGIYVFSASKEESYYPDGYIPATAEGYVYVTLEIETFRDSNTGELAFRASGAFENKIDGYEGLPTVDVFGFEFPDLLAQYHEGYRTVSITVGYPPWDDNKIITVEDTFLFEENVKTLVTFGPFLIFDLNERHGFVMSIDEGDMFSVHFNNDYPTETGWEDEFVLTSDFEGRFD